MSQDSLDSQPLLWLHLQQPGGADEEGGGSINYWTEKGGMKKCAEGWYEWQRGSGRKGVRKYGGGKISEDNREQ